ncbi:MAG: EpsI family protein, partial [Verrucomicrobia subdivision 3 bacterium]|nr:EpsI family protein [Limisphaerales bacterium]
MNRLVAILGAMALLIMAACAWFLANWHARQALGTPGVRVIDEPLFGVEDPSKNDTNVFVASPKRIYLPDRVLNYDSTDVPITRQVLDWLPEDTTYGQKHYRATNGLSIQVQVVLMGKDRTSIHQPQYCLTGQGWTRTAQELLAVRVSQPHAYDLPVMRLKLHQKYRAKDGSEHALSGIFVYWFVADGQLTARHGQMNWWIARDLLTRAVLQRWAFVT